MKTVFSCYTMLSGSECKDAVRRLVDILQSIRDAGNNRAGHVAYLTKAQMASLAEEALDCVTRLNL